MLRPSQRASIQQVCLVSVHQSMDCVIKSLGFQITSSSDDERTFLLCCVLNALLVMLLHCSIMRQSPQKTRENPDHDLNLVPWTQKCRVGCSRWSFVGLVSGSLSCCRAAGRGCCLAAKFLRLWRCCTIGSQPGSLQSSYRNEEPESLCCEIKNAAACSF